MSVNAITSAVGSYVQKVVSSVPAQSSVSSPLQEAQETSAVTAKEAARGDRQAKAKLAVEEQKQQALENLPTKERGKGDLIDHYV